MDNYHTDGDGGEELLANPIDGNSMIHEYNDKKAFTGCLIAAISFIALIVLSAVIYSVTTVILNVINLITN